MTASMSVLHRNLIKIYIYNDALVVKGLININIHLLYQFYETYLLTFSNGAWKRI